MAEAWPIPRVRTILPSIRVAASTRGKGNGAHLGEHLDLDLDLFLIFPPLVVSVDETQRSLEEAPVTFQQGRVDDSVGHGPDSSISILTLLRQSESTDDE